MGLWHMVYACVDRKDQLSAALIDSSSQHVYNSLINDHYVLAR